MRNSIYYGYVDGAGEGKNSSLSLLLPLKNRSCAAHDRTGRLPVPVTVLVGISFWLDCVELSFRKLVQG